MIPSVRLGLVLHDAVPIGEPQAAFVAAHRDRVIPEERCQVGCRLQRRPLALGCESIGDQRQTEIGLTERNPDGILRPAT